MTDDAKWYTRVGEEFASHESTEHGKGEYVRGDVHTNTVENYFSILKRGIIGVYHHVVFGTSATLLWNSISDIQTAPSLA